MEAYYEEAPGMYYTDDLLPHAPLKLSSYWGCGQVFIHNVNNAIKVAVDVLILFKK